MKRRGVLASLLALAAAPWVPMPKRVRTWTTGFITVAANEGPMILRKNMEIWIPPEPLGPENVWNPSVRITEINHETKVITVEPVKDTLFLAG